MITMTIFILIILVILLLIYFCNKRYSNEYLIKHGWVWNANIYGDVQIYLNARSIWKKGNRTRYSYELYDINNNNFINQTN